jgi:hypothetical protein
MKEENKTRVIVSNLKKGKCLPKNIMIKQGLNLF